MTTVRHGGRPHRTPANQRERKARGHEAPTPAPASRIAQVRLRSDELAALQAVMRTLHLGSTSEAFREGPRLLAREAAEIDAAADIRAFYGPDPVPLPAGVAPPTDAEPSAADAVQW